MKVIETNAMCSRCVVRERTSEDFPSCGLYHVAAIRPWALFIEIDLYLLYLCLQCNIAA